MKINFRNSIALAFVISFFIIALVYINLRTNEVANSNDNLKTANAKKEFTIADKENDIVDFLLTKEDKNSVCEKILERKFQSELISIECKVKGYNYTLHYEPVNQVLGFGNIDANESIIDDNNLDGSIDYARTKTGEQLYVNYPELNALEGLQFRTDWQTEFENRIQIVHNLITKDPASR